MGDLRRLPAGRDPAPQRPRRAPALGADGRGLALIETARLRLIPARHEHYEAIRDSDAALGALLGAPVAEGWEGLLDHRDAIANSDAFLAAHPEAAEWWMHLFLLDGMLVGVGGFKGEPADGAAEIGYALAPAWRGRGLAREAARGLVQRAFEHPEVSEVRAHTLPEANRSTRLLEALGFRCVETVHDPEDGEIWRWVIARG